MPFWIYHVQYIAMLHNESVTQRNNIYTLLNKATFVFWQLTYIH